jgi:hypothetical protein
MAIAQAVNLFGQVLNFTLYEFIFCERLHSHFF